MVIFLINSLFGIFLTYKMVGILLKRLRISVKACILLYFIYYDVGVKTIKNFAPISIVP